MSPAKEFNEQTDQTPKKLLNLHKSESFDTEIEDGPEDYGISPDNKYLKPSLVKSSSIIDEF